MRFSFLAVAACLASAMRPQLDKSQVGKTARMRDVLSQVTKTKDLAALKETTDSVSGILAEFGQNPGALDHMTEDDQDVLHFAVLTFENLIFASLDDCHEDNIVQLDDAIHAIEQCNVDVAFRQSPQGDLGKLETAVSIKQVELNRLQGVVDVKTEINNTRWEEFDSHMQLIAKPPACPGLPARTLPALDLYFEESLYVIWFASQQSSYIVVRDAWVFANANLESAIEAYEIQLAVRRTQYCDWRTELEAACAAFDVCYAETSGAYTTLAQEVTGLMDERITIKKSGDIIIHQIRFLLGEVPDQEAPPVDTSSYEIEFPEIPAKGLCDLSPLDSDEWVPTVQCAEEEVLFEESFEGASAATPLLCPNGNECRISAWSNPSHPSYVKLWSNSGAEWATPFGQQSISVFGYQRCPGKLPCGPETNENAFNEAITAGVTYTVTFNVAAQANFGDYQVEFAAVVENGQNKPGKWTRTTLAAVQGTAKSKDFSTEGTLTFTAKAGQSYIGQRLAIRLLDRDEGSWRETPLFDNIRVTKITA